MNTVTYQQLDTPLQFSRAAAAKVNELIAEEGNAALKLRDYGRIDCRLAENGRVYILEANPTPWLDPIAEYAMAAKEAGIGYTEMIGRIVDEAMKR